MDEDARRHVAGGRNFETTANTMMISRHGSQRKTFGGFAVIGLQHCGQVMQAECVRRSFVPKQSALTFETATTQSAAP
jgi:hypothetical protein